jgi:crotonobetainyl-CoA:carnitine CoA-transferase CaiB-like acyl-CoA transferase
MASRPLDGVRVLEFGNYLAAPYAGAILADFGADVIKVERPGFLDRNRLSGGRADPADPERSFSFMNLGRGKRSLTLDIRTDDGRDLFSKLAATADVLLENFRPGTLEKLGLGPELLLERNPRLVVLRLSGFGQTGPLSGLQGTDRTAQAFTGLMYVTGHPELPPVKAGLPIMDYIGGLTGALGVLLALRAAERAVPGERSGQVIDLALYDPVLPMLGDYPERIRRYGEAYERTGNHIRRTAPGDTYQAADGRWLLLSAPSDAIFARLAEAIGRPELAADARYATPDDRELARGELTAIVREWAAGRTRAEALTSLAAASVPAAPVNSVPDLMADPHVAARGGFVEVADERLGPVLVAAPQPALTRTPGRIERTAPRPGEHTDEILRELAGLGDVELEALRRAGVI